MKLQETAIQMLREYRRVHGRKLMDCNTGHLINRNYLDKLSEAEAKRYESVPKELNTAALIKLKGAEETMVSLTSGGKLSRFAASVRKSRKAMQKASRKNNR